MSWIFLNRVLTCWTFAWMHILSFIQVFVWILPRDDHARGNMWCYASAAYAAVRRPPVCVCVWHVRIVSKRTTILVFPYQTLWQRADGDPLTGRQMQVKNGNSSPSGSGQSPAAKCILVQFKAQISNLWVVPNCKKTQIIIIINLTNLHKEWPVVYSCKEWLK